MPSEPIAPAAVDAVISAYYPDALKASENARTRAQTAYTIASAVAAAIIAGGVFGDIPEEPWGVQALGVATLCIWLLAAGLFIWAITAPTSQHAAEHPDASAFVRAVIQNVDADRRKVVGRQNVAYGFTVGALVLTVALIITLLAVAPESSKTSGTVILTPAAVKNIQMVCSGAKQELSGEYDPSDLSKSFLGVDLGAGVCPEGTTTLQVPRSGIQAATQSSDAAAKKAKAAR